MAPKTQIEETVIRVVVLKNGEVILSGHCWTVWQGRLFAEDLVELFPGVEVELYECRDENSPSRQLLAQVRGG